MKKKLRKALALSAALVFTVMSFIAFPVLEVHAAAVTPETGNIYYIKNKNSGLYLTVENDSSAAGANVVQATGTGSLGQRWILEKNSSTGYYRIHPATDMTGGISLDVANGSSENKTNIQIWSNNGCSAQNFAIKPADSNMGYYIATEVSGFNSVVDVTSAKTTTGANVHQYANTGKDNQIWYFEQAPWPSSNSSSSSSNSNTSSSSSSTNTTTSSLQTGYIADGWYYIKNVNSQKYVEVADGKDENGANVQQYQGNGYPCQRWYVTNVGGGYITLKTGMSSGKMMDVTAGKATDGTNVELYNENGKDPQKFKPIKTSTDGVFCLTTKCSGDKQAVDVYGWSTANKGNINTWTYNGLACQQFVFEAINTSSSSSQSSSTASTTTSSALSTVYPQQQLNFVNCSDGKYLNDNGINGGVLTSNGTSATSNRWVLSYVNSGVYRIINAATGYCFTPFSSSVTSGNGVAAAKVTSGDKSQYWKIVAVKNDANGIALNYKIVNYNNTNLALTLSNGSYKLANYNGSTSQCFRVNSYGVEGFAGYSKDMSGREKACITGGVFGQTVTVKSLSDLQKYAAGSTPYTIVIGANMSQNALTKVNVGSNKTFVGSYNAHTLNNIHFRNIQASGNNIYKNITFTHSVNINNNDDIQMYISDGNNFWLDHCSWPGHNMNQDTSIHHNDTDKFLYVGLKANFVSVNDCFFGGHKYGLILGYPGEDGHGTYTGYPCMTISNCYFKQTLTRAPGLMRYGYFHCYNNYVYDFDLGYTPYTDCNIYSEKNYFEAGSHKGCVVNAMDYIGRFTDSGSVLSWDISTAKIAGASSFRPSNNYWYSTRDPQSAKNWVVRYAGAQSGALTYSSN